MAGDWIKMGTDLSTRAEVVRMMSACDADKCPQHVRIVGALHAAWSWFGANTTDGCAPGMTADQLDFVVGWPGFSAAMKSVGWLVEDAKGLQMPNFERHNGKAAKRRAQESERKTRVRNVSACDADKKRTREEKRREEDSPPNPPRGGRGGGGGSSGRGGKPPNPLIAEARESGEVAARFVEHFPSVNDRAGWSRLQFDKLGEDVARRRWDMAKFDAVMAKVRDKPRDARYPTPTPNEVFSEIRKQAASDYRAAGGAA